MFALKPDFAEVLNRFEAWWQCEIVDRPLVTLPFAAEPVSRATAPVSTHATPRERWLDADFLVASVEARMRNTIFYADSLPVAWPNLGPEIFSALYGCPMHYGERTAWSEPILEDWSEDSLRRLQLDWNHPFLHKLNEMTDALIEAGRGRFLVGYTDLHGGADALAAFRDPQELLLDTIEHPEEIRLLCDRITTDFLEVYDLFHARLAAVGMPSVSWLPAIGEGRVHIPSNDFSCMISNQDFQDLFLPGIVRECRHMDRCIYHLDGPQALRHLDTLLAQPEIHAIQWVPGAGRSDWKDWIPVYQRIQQAHRALVIHAVPAGELPLLFASLDPAGVWIGGVPEVRDHATADRVLRDIAGWTCRRSR